MTVLDQLVRNENLIEVDMSAGGSPVSLPVIDLSHHGNAPLASEVLVGMSGGTLCEVRAYGLFHPEDSPTSQNQYYIGSFLDTSNNTEYNIQSGGGAAVGQKRIALPHAMTNAAGSIRLPAPYLLYTVTFDHTAGKIRLGYHKV